MKVNTRLTVPTLLLFMASMAWANISTDYDHKASFQNYKTYSWGKIESSDSLWDQRIRDAVGAQLALKGMTVVASGRRCSCERFWEDSRGTHSTRSMTALVEAGDGVDSAGSASQGSL